MVDVLLILAVVLFAIVSIVNLVRLARLRDFATFAVHIGACAMAALLFAEDIGSSQAAIHKVATIAISLSALLLITCVVWRSRDWFGNPLDPG